MARLCLSAFTPLSLLFFFFFFFFLWLNFGHHFSFSAYLYLFFFFFYLFIVRHNTYTSFVHEIYKRYKKNYFSLVNNTHRDGAKVEWEAGATIPPFF